jgi:hypothetical protein
MLVYLTLAMLFNLILENKGKAASSRTLDANTQRREITVTGRDRMRIGCLYTNHILECAKAK